MFENFERVRVEAGGAEINLVRGGEGPPVLLLHGYPQTHSMWHEVAPRLAENFTVVAADLRGYGDSSKPFSSEDHATYSKRAMAADQVQVMESLGFPSFAVVGHDRGGRVGHRMALDHPDRVTRLAVLDIVPTRHVYATVGKDLATAYYHWFFFIQPYDLPETLIGADPGYYLRKKLGGWGTKLDTFAPEALAEYERCFSDPATIHASCEDYRAAASIDLVHDDADRGEGRKVACPLLALWGGQGVMERLYDVEDVWREYAWDVRGGPIDAGHFLAEERPGETARELANFLEG
ncbi:MAG: alpha/beta hydrolase [Actinomycetota bacterium]|jgi:haloacetate dehalogenase|nr:alpha/beta hydrolase [Actinomycetota bacterium]